MPDTLTAEERSARMALVRGRGNKSTERLVAHNLRRAGITGWRRHVRGFPGTPDFYFPRERLAVFVDGCFWHACPRCGRIPKSRVEFWSAKIDANRRRDNRNRRALRAQGVATIRIWEHELRSRAWVGRLSRRLDARRASLGADVKSVVATPPPPDARKTHHRPRGLHT